MTDLSWSEIIQANPIGDGLDAFRKAFESARSHLDISPLSEAVLYIVEKNVDNLIRELLLAFQVLPATRLLLSKNGNGILLDDIDRFIPSIRSKTYDTERSAILCQRIVDYSSETDILNALYNLVTESTPPPRPLPFLFQTPHLQNTSSLVNSSEHMKYMDQALKEELGYMQVEIPGFYEAFFGVIEGLETASATIFNKCKEGNNPLYREEVGWRDWPESAKEKEVLEWLTKRVELILDFAQEQVSAPKARRKLLARPHQSLQGSTADRKLDVGIVNNQTAGEDTISHWSQILVPGELKSNPNCDTFSKAWLDLGRYVREVLAAQDRRRFVHGFTLCGPKMRLWEFDRVGAIASSAIDINQDGLRFVSAVLGYLWMNEEQLGFDPTIGESDENRYIEITRHGHKERLVIDHLMKRAPCVAGRATTCWKAYREGDKSKIPLVIKDSWQYPEREVEGRLLRDAMEKGVVNTARYYHHETVFVGGKEDDICNNVRKGLDITKATNDRPKRLAMPQKISTRSGRSTSTSSAGRKRPSSHTDAPLPPRKRTRSSSLAKSGKSSAQRNRVHRRVIVRDYGKAIYKASSRAAMLAALGGCIEGYESLHLKAGMLQRDVSIGNLIMNEESENPSWPSFLIDLDLAVEEHREEPSGAQGRTGTRAFMAIGVLYNEKHSFMHDLESFFWVLFWVCIHYNEPGKEGRVTEYDCWNYEDTTKLADLKKGTVSHEGDFLRKAKINFTPYYQKLVPWMNRLRKAVFPNDRRWEEEDRTIYSRMREILREAQKDSSVLAE